MTLNAPFPSRSFFLRAAAVLSLGPVLVGCSSVAGTFNASTAGSPATRSAGESEMRQDPWLLVATTRAPVKGAKASPYFGSKRNGVTYARVNFGTPPSGSFAGMFGDDCQSLGTVVKAGASAVGLIGNGWDIESVDLMAPESVVTTLDGAMGNREVLVYVHGFNTTFEQATVDAAGLADRIGFGGKTMIFTWPSKAGLLDYNYDRESALASRDALENLLKALVARPGAGRVHLVAHSMGAMLSLEALRQLYIGSHASLTQKLGAIVLASPDIDVDVFRNSLSRMPGGAQKMTIITASDDRALAVSSRLAGGVARVGASDAETLRAFGMRVVDASNQGCGLLNHALFLSEGSVRKVVKQSIEQHSGVPGE